jgi:hypothetical protein
MLKVDDSKVTTQKLEHTLPLTKLLDTVVNIGDAMLTPVDDGYYQIPFKFTGKIGKITTKLDPPQLTPDDVKKLKEAELRQAAESQAGISGTGRQGTICRYPARWYCATISTRGLAHWLGELSRVSDKQGKNLMRMLGWKGPPDEQPVCGDPLPVGAGRHTLRSQRPEGGLGICVTAFNRQFFGAFGRIF